MRIKGSGIYAAGIVIGHAGGAFVVVEKRPRRRTREILRDGERVTETVQREVTRDGQRLLDDIWDDALIIVGAERLTGPMGAMVAHVADALGTPPLEGEHIATLETTSTGEALVPLFRERKCFVRHLQIGGEAVIEADGVFAVPIGAMQACVTLAFEEHRLSVVEKLAQGPALLRSLENLAALPATGPMRDLTLAAAIAAWTAKRFASHGPRASRKPPCLDDATGHEAFKRAFLFGRKKRKGRLT